MKVAALIGDPVQHSVAPILHEYLARLHHIEFRYVKLRIPTHSLGAAADAMNTLGFAGYNITIPHKEDIAAHLYEVDAVASAMGAVNTVVINEHGTARGTNTDWIGIVEGLVHYGHPRQAPPDRSAVVLGSGGAARAAIYALGQMGYSDISVFYQQPVDNKTKRLQQLADESHGFTTKPYDEVVEAIDQADVVCNMTSAGMHGNDPAPFDLARIAGLDLSNKWFFDAVFNPLDTPFLQAGKAGGAQCVDGLWMMIFQGIPAFQAWIDRPDISLDEAQCAEIHQVLAQAITQH